jgi:AcrR family transcriptional regulator
MVSYSDKALRRIPQQRRGRRRVDGFLRAAASVLAEMGYERATMCMIAKRANSSIGSLYQFFPNKHSVAEAVRVRYMEEIQQYWLKLADEAPQLHSEQLAGRLVTLQLEIVANYPALLVLLDVPPTSRTSKQREIIRTRIAEVLMVHKPKLTNSTAVRIASVVQQVSRGMLALYAKTEAGQKTAIIEEFNSVLVGYLVPRLKC